MVFLCHQFSGAPTGELLVSGRVYLPVKGVDVIFFCSKGHVSSLESLSQIHGVDLTCVFF